MTRILDGRPIAKAINASLASRISRLAQSEVTPGLAVLLFGDDSPSLVYGRMIGGGCERIGISFRLVQLPGDISPEQAAENIDELNRDSSIHGILIKRPLPGPLSDERLLQRTDPAKDVDGYHFQNVGSLVVGGASRAPVPCTPAGVLELLCRTGNPPDGKHVVVLGRSATVGKPLANLLCQKDEGANATVTLCHSHTRNLETHTRSADIIVTAVGIPSSLKADMVSARAVVIDVGTNAVDDPSSKRGYRLVGDADYDDLLGHCAAITPVPGGVGPVTVAMLLKNVVDAAERSGS
ncbi:MAG: bifunctional 5,10-methylenetetrahydrofolate dehydrogenase/5,10-methenyltetrahydrofolate cyclohydrolase [Planctomycetota bacterium]